MFCKLERHRTLISFNFKGSLKAFIKQAQGPLVSDADVNALALSASEQVSNRTGEQKLSELSRILTA